MTVNVSIGKENNTIPYSVGVQQGDNMAPVLFIFVMLAFTDITNKNWTSRWGMPKIQFNHFPSQTQGRLISQSSNSKGIIFDLLQLLYVDDGTFLFNSREDLEKGSQHIYDTFRMLGLTMHIGTNGATSKSEAMFVSPSLQLDSSPIYNTEPILLNEGNILFCKEFKYLGSMISKNLKDDLEIETRIKKANMQYGSLKNILTNQKIKLNTKVLLYKAIILNTVLWGCESWSLTAELIRKLEVFQNKMIRRILKIDMYMVQEDRITNTNIRKQFCNISKIQDVITRRQLKWVGNITQMEETRMPKKIDGLLDSKPKKAR